MHNMTTLRVSIHGVQTPVAANYYVQLDSSTIWKDTSAESHRKVVRTETSFLNSMPNFVNNSFVLEIQQPIRAGSKAVEVLSVNLVRKLPPPVKSELDATEVVASSKLTLNKTHTQTLSRGDKVSLSLELIAQKAMHKKQHSISLELVLLAQPLWIAPPAADSRDRLLCSVLVVCAESIPITKLGAEDCEPSCFVAVSASRDKGRGISCRGMTYSVPNNANPVWEEWLQLDISDIKPSREQLVFSIIDETSQSSIIDYKLPLDSLTPGPHHNLHLVTSKYGPTLTITVQIPPFCTEMIEVGMHSPSSSDTENSSGECMWISASILQHWMTASLPSGSNGYMVQVMAASSKKQHGRQNMHCFAEIDVSNLTCRERIKNSLSKTHKKIGNEWPIDFLPLQGQTEVSLWPSYHPAVVHTDKKEAKFLFLRIYSMNYWSDARGGIPIGTSVLELGDSGTYNGRAQIARCDILDQDSEIIGEAIVQFSVVTGRFPRPEDISNTTGPGFGFSALTCGTTKSQLNTLIHDLYSMQASLASLLMSSENAESSAQLNRARLQDSEKKRTALERELQHLQSILHEERKAIRHPLDKDITHLSIEDEGSMAYVEALANSLKVEIQKNRQLEHRVQQMHKLEMEVKEGRLKYSDLKEAHVIQSKQLR